jgi:MFS family permease
VTDNLKKLFISFGFQGAAFGAMGVVISLFVVVGLDGNVANASVASAFYALGNLVGSMIVGILLDRYPKFFEVVFVSAVVDAFVAILMAFVKNIAFYYIFALILGTFSAMMGPAITIYLNKTFDESGYRKKINTMNLFNSVGVTVGTFIGSLWLSYFTLITENTERMRLIFIISTLLLIVSSVLSSGYLKKREFLKTFRSKKIFPNMHSLADHVVSIPHNIFLSFNSSGFKVETRKYMMSIFFIFFGANMIFSIFSIYLNTVLMISSGAVLMIYGFNNIFTNAAYFLTNRFTKKFKDSSLVRGALWTRVVMFGSIAISGYFLPVGVWITIIAFLVIGFTWPLFYIPTTVHITNLALPTDRGRIIGLFNVVINFAVIAASFISGYIALELGYVAAFIFGIAFLFIGERLIHGMNTAMPIPKDIFAKISSGTSAKDERGNDVY